jgi:hypothetical protein
MEKLYAKDKEIAALLNMSFAAFRKNADTLVVQYGFPPIDPVINQRYLPAVHEWAKKRNENLQNRATPKTPTTKKENLNALGA